MNTIWLIAAICMVIGVAVFMGPTRIVARAALRRFQTVGQMRRWQHAVTIGFGLGAAAGVALAGATLGLQTALAVATLSLVLLLAAMDLAWRWLPFIWTIPLILLGALNGWLAGSLLENLTGAMLGAGSLFTLQLYFVWQRGIEALGTGDIWLAAGLGLLAGPDKIMFILGVAALSALASEGLAKLASRAPTRQRLGVAYGAHMCFAYLVFVPL